MNTPMDTTTIQHTLTGILTEALRVPPSKITVSARLFADLGAESIDLLDIRFRMEHAFQLKIESDAISRSMGPDLTASQIRERLTVGALAAYAGQRLDAVTGTP